MDERRSIVGAPFIGVFISVAVVFDEFAHDSSLSSFYRFMPSLTSL